MSIAKIITNELITLNETKTIVIHEPTHEDYYQMYYPISLAFTINSNLGIDSQFSLMSSTTSYMIFKDSSKHTYILIQITLDVIDEESFDITFIYCKDSQDLANALLKI